MTNKKFPRISSYKPKNTSGERRLKWFTDYMRVADISIGEAASIMGYSKPSIHAWKAVDDINIGNLMKVAEAVGDRIVFKLWKGDPEEVDKVTRREMRLVVPGHKEPHRLAPLAAAMCLYGENCFSLAKKMKVCQTTVRHWLEVDDIYMSRLLEVASTMGCNLMIRVVKEESTVVSQPEGPVFITAIDGIESETEIKKYLA